MIISQPEQVLSACLTLVQNQGFKLPNCFLLPWKQHKSQPQLQSFAVVQKNKDQALAAAPQAIRDAALLRDAQVPLRTTERKPTEKSHTLLLIRHALSLP